MATMDGKLPVQNRPQNCGTGYCSCIECVMEPTPVQDPDEWLTGCPECGMDSGCDCDSGTWNPPATQRQWVGLTEQDIGKACGFAEHTTDSTRFALKAISRAIEAKLKELNT